MGFFSKNKNTNNNLAEVEQDDKSQKVALRTMQQDLVATKESGEAINAVVIESISRHSQTAEKSDLADQKKTLPPAPRELSKLAETEHTKGGQADKDSSEFLTPNLSSIAKEQKIPASAPVPSKAPQPLKAPILSPLSQTVGVFIPESAKLSAAENKTKTKEKRDSFLRKLPKNLNNVSKIVIIFIGIAVIITAAGTVYFFAIKNNSSSEIPSGSIPPVEEPIKNPKVLENQFRMFEFENNYDIDLSFDVVNNYGGKIKRVLEEKISSADLKIPAFDFINIEISIDGEFPAGGEIISGILENFPEIILGKIGKSYNLVAYLEGNSPRLGIILEISDKNGLVDLLRDNEVSFSEILSELYFDKSEIGTANSKNFSETVYKNAVIRYKNFPGHTSAVDYAILDNFLLLATSKDNMFKLVDFVEKASTITVQEIQKNLELKRSLNLEQ